MEVDRNRPAAVTGYPALNTLQPNGYPYAAAMASTYNYQNQNQNQNYQNGVCFGRFFALSLLVFFILATVRVVVWYVHRPHLPEFRVDSLSISNFTVGNNSLVSFTAEIKLTARNPNDRISVAYDHILTGIYYKLNSLADTTIAPFYQLTKTETSLTAKFAALGSFVDDKSVVEGVNGTSTVSVEFNVRLVSTVRLDGKRYMSRKIFKVLCGHLLVELPPANGRSGTLTGTPKQCGRVDL